MKGVLGWVLVSAVLTGCASVQPRLGFEDVQSGVSERIGAGVHWYGDAAADAEAERAVAALLAEPLSADAAVQIALLNNRDLQAVYEDLHVAQADLVRAGLLRNPVFEGALRWPTSGAGHAVELGVAMSFLDVLWIPLRKRIAEAELESTKIRIMGAVLDIAGRVRAAYFDAVAAEQRLEMERTVLDSFAASHELASRLHAAGNIRDLDLSNELAAYEEAKIALSRAETSLLMARERLNELMGLWGERTRWRTSGRLDEPGEAALPGGAEAERRAVERSLELAGLRREVEVAARRAGVARPEALLGDLEIGAGAEREVEGHWSVGPAVAGEIPLFDQGQAREMAARAELAGAMHRLHATAVRVRSRSRALLAGVEDASSRARYYRDVVLPLRERIVRETQLQYNAMQVSPFQLLEARRALARAGGEYIDAQREYWVNAARLELLLAGGMSAAGEPEQGAVMGRSGGAQIGAGDH